MRIFQEEVFGPVLTVTSFKTEAEAIALANDCDFGLGAAVWTSNVARAHRVAHRVEAGMIWVNDHHKNDPAVPWGGFKDSGMGKENGWECFYEYTKSQSVVVNLADDAVDWFAGGEKARYS
jgi:acyl-CoA reductase-like NAD-dependent aldehyde dehydrogenase